jgi:hypothetical protein
MTTDDMAKELVAVARMVAEEGSPGLNGMNNREARKFVSQLLHRHTKGFFKDEYWQPVTATFKELSRHGVDYVVTETQYYQDDRGNPSSKVWRFEVEFVNDKGRMTKLYGTITAAGAGTVQDLLSRYDVTAVIN